MGKKKSIQEPTSPTFPRQKPTLCRSTPSDETYQGVPKIDNNKKYQQKNDTHFDKIYHGIRTQSDKWIEMACEEAYQSVLQGGGPFGAVLLEIDNSSGQILRFWRDHNHVTQWNDPTAHAEIAVIRAACQELERFDLGKIHKKNQLKPKKQTSHCILYSSAEPCPMCYGAIAWARIPVLIFAATRFDTASKGVNFSDAALYHEIALPPRKRHKLRTLRLAQTHNALDAFNLWKKSEKILY
ncbi:MAG: nucleoside deaminase [Magnetococcus sp. DMHC-6]